MSTRRPIKEKEKVIVQFLLEFLKITDSQTIPEIIEEYGASLGINFTLTDDPNDYAGDLIEVHYIDEDQIPVVIILTKNKEGKILDLDFWKTDNSKILKYPTIDRLIFKDSGLN